jgi:hypothetical protein
MDNRVERIKELLKQRRIITDELKAIMQQQRLERAAFSEAREPRKKKQADVPAAAKVEAPKAAAVKA